MKRIRLTNKQCRIFLRDMHEFGYPTLTFADVRKIADDLADGKESDDVVALIMAKQIDEACS